MPADVEPPPLPPPPPPLPGSMPWRLRPAVGDESSWASLVRIVRKEDEDQIERCQEKLNTYLNFSGLFSITISILLVDSFKALQPNYAAMTVELLGRIAARDQHDESRVLLALNPHLPSPPAASYVNALWTASLGISLLGVSLGFLFKQWLHDLVRPNSSSPQAELRTRYSRQADWSIVELATVLPFGAQISMALFFAGLCILTFDVNRSASYTAMSIAASWAALFALVIVAPIFHPHCPYKLPFTEPIASHIRTSLFQSRSIAGGPFRSVETESALEAGITYDRLEGHPHCEEADIDALVAIYSKRREAHILNIMWDALKENGATPENLLLLVQKVIYSAHPPSPQDVRGYEKLATPVAAKNLRSVPNSAYCTILDNVADLLQDEFLRQTGANDSKSIEWSPWMKEALCIILADSPYAVSAGANIMLAKLMNEDRAEATFDTIISSLVNGSTSTSVTAEHFTFIFDRILGVMKMIPTQDCAPCLSALLRRCFGAQPLLKNDFGRGLLFVLEEHKSKMPSSCLQSIASLVIKRLTDDLYSSMYWYHHIVDLFESLLFIDDVLSSEVPSGDINSLHERMVKMARLLLVQGRNTAIFMCYASGLTNDQNEVLIKAASRLYIDAFVTSTAVARHDIISNITASLQWQQFTHPEKMDNKWDRFVRLHVTKTYLLVLQGVQELQKRGLFPEKDSEAEKVFKEILDELTTIVADSVNNAVGQHEDSKQDEQKDGEDTPGGSNPVLHESTDEIVGDDRPASDSAKLEKKDEDESRVSEEDADNTNSNDEDEPLPPPNTRFERDVDVAKRCLLEINALDRVTVPAGGDNDTSDIPSSSPEFPLFSDNIIQALLKIVPFEDLGSDVGEILKMAKEAWDKREAEHDIAQQIDEANKEGDAASGEANSEASPKKADE